MPGRHGAGSAVSEIKTLLEASRGKLLSVLIDSRSADSPTDYDQFLAQQKSAAIDAALAELEAGALDISSRKVNEAAGKGLDVVKGKLSKLQVSAPFIAVDLPTIALVRDIAGAQIKGVLSSVKSKVNFAMQRAIAGALSVSELQREIRDAFKGNVTSGRIERILRTETVRAFTQSQAAADEKIAGSEVAVELIKVWRATKGQPNRTRLSHALIDGQEREFDQLFNVGGGATAETLPGSPAGFKANAPVDPSLPAEEAVHCRCSVDYIPRSKSKRSYIEKDPEKARAQLLRRQGAA